MRRRAAVTAVGTALSLLLLGLVNGVAFGEDPVATPSASATVNIRDFSYRPATLNVSRGTTVTFANRDSVRHTATRRGSFTTGRIRAGKAKSVRFASRGTYRYFCTLHPEMRGKIVVN